MYVDCDADMPAKLSLASLNRIEQQATRRKGEFLRGPIPLAWLASAGALSGKALAVGIFIWWRAGIEKRRSDLKFSCRKLGRFAVSRHACARGLSALEQAELVTVERQPGKCARVTIVAKEDRE